MALAKIEGLDVTPPRPSSSRSCSSVPPWTIVRRRKSSQTLWPASRSCSSGFLFGFGFGVEVTWSLLRAQQGLGAGGDVLWREAELLEQPVGGGRCAEVVERH